MFDVLIILANAKNVWWNLKQDEHLDPQHTCSPTRNSWPVDQSAFWSFAFMAFGRRPHHYFISTTEQSRVKGLNQQWQLVGAGI